MTPPPAAAPGLLKLIGSTLKVDRKGHVRLSLSCGAGTLDCKGALDVKTAGKVRVGKRSKILTVVAKHTVKVSTGKHATLNLALSEDARGALKRHASLTVVVTYKPSGGKALAKRLRLRR